MTPNFLPIIRDNQAEVRNRTDELFGVTEEPLIEIAWRMVNARTNCTANDALPAPGTQSYFTGVREVRTLLIQHSKQQGWAKDETGGVPSAIHVERKIRVTVQNTDAGTGLRNGYPKQISERGPMFDRIIDTNQRMLGQQIEMTGILETSISSKRIIRLNPDDGVMTWYLCVYYEAAVGNKPKIVRAEISCPILGDDGFFQPKGFVERLFLIGFGGGDGGVKIGDQEPGGGGPDFDIPVVRKQQAL